MSYTKGSWEVHKNKSGIAILSRLDRGGFEVVVQERQLSPEGIAVTLKENDARLIAAAPELLDALKLWLKFWDKMPIGKLEKIVCDIGILNDAFIATSNAIAKAGGVKCEK